MSDTGTFQNTSHLKSYPNPSPSKSHADLIPLDENIAVDKDSAPLEIPPCREQSNYPYFTRQSSEKQCKIKASLTFKCMTEHLFADFSYSIALDTYL